MTTPACPSYAGYRFPAEIISHAVGTVNLWSWGRDSARSGRRARSYAEAMTPVTSAQT